MNKINLLSSKKTIVVLVAAASLGTAAMVGTNAAIAAETKPVVQNVAVSTADFGNAEKAVKKADAAATVFNKAQVKKTELNNTITAAQNKVKTLTEAVKGDKKVVDELAKLVKDPKANTDEAKRLKTAKAQLAQHEKDLKAATDAQDRAYDALDEYQTGEQFDARIAFNKATDAARKAVEPLFTAAKAKLTSLDATLKQAVKNNDALETKVKDLTAKLAAKPDDAKLKSDLELAKSQASVAKDAVVTAQNAKTAYEQGEYAAVKAPYEKIMGYVKTLTVNVKTPDKKPTPAPEHGLFDGVNLDDVLNYHMNPINVGELGKKDEPKIDIVKLLSAIDGVKAAGYKLTPADVSELVNRAESANPATKLDIVELLKHVDGDKVAEYKLKHIDLNDTPEAQKIDIVALLKKVDGEKAAEYKLKPVDVSELFKSEDKRLDIVKLLANVDGDKVADYKLKPADVTELVKNAETATPDRKLDIEELLKNVDGEKAAEYKMHPADVSELFMNQDWSNKDDKKTDKKDDKKVDVKTPATGSLPKTGVAVSLIAGIMGTIGAAGTMLKRYAKR
jgi:hypothetical protein